MFDWRSLAGSLTLALALTVGASARQIQMKQLGPFSQPETNAVSRTMAAKLGDAFNVRTGQTTPTWAKGPDGRCRVRDFLAYEFAKAIADAKSHGGPWKVDK